MVAHIPDSSIRDLSEKSSAAQKIYDSLGNLRLPPGCSLPPLDVVVQYHHRPDRRGRNSAPHRIHHHQQCDHYEIRIEAGFRLGRGQLQKSPPTGGDLRLWEKGQVRSLYLQNDGDVGLPFMGRGCYAYLGPVAGMIEVQVRILIVLGDMANEFFQGSVLIIVLGDEGQGRTYILQRCFSVWRPDRY